MKKQQKSDVDKKVELLPVTNEIKSNIFVFRVFLASFLVFPMLLLGKYLGYYSGTSYKRFFAIMVFALFCDLAIYVITKFYIEKPVTKYVCLIISQIFRDDHFA